MPRGPDLSGLLLLLLPAIGILTLVGGGILFTLAWLNERDTRPRLSNAIQSQNHAYAAQEGIAGQVVILLRKRTALNYLLEPLINNLWRSGSEQ